MFLDDKDICEVWEYGMIYLLGWFEDVVFWRWVLWMYKKCVRMCKGL